MNYFFDTEFLEGPQEKKMFGFKIGKTQPTIDLISISIVSEDGREYYAISKDFNLKEAWNRFQYKERTNVERSNGFDPQKEYWIRDKVLKPIFDEYYIEVFDTQMPTFNYKSFCFLIKNIGKTNRQIAKEIIVYTSKKVDYWRFVLRGPLGNYPEDIVVESDTKYYDNNECWRAGLEYKSGHGHGFRADVHKYSEKTKPIFYAYYADYDWVVFCWIFGTMVNLPKGFPMYCKDLKQILDEKVDEVFIDDGKGGNLEKGRLDWIKSLPHYPKQENEHNALDDAKWNLSLYKFIKTLNI